MQHTPEAPAFQTGLSQSSRERLHKLQEELGEAQVAVAHVLLHGWESRHPDGGPTNRESLVNELGDIQAVTKYMCDQQDLSRSSLNDRVAYKRPIVTRWMHYQGPPSPEMAALHASRDGEISRMFVRREGDNLLYGQSCPRCRGNHGNLECDKCYGVGILNHKTTPAPTPEQPKSEGEQHGARYDYGDLPPQSPSDPTLRKSATRAVGWTKEKMAALRKAIGLKA